MLAAGAALGNDEKPLNRILFGSCSKPSLDQPLWPVILANQPDLWIWLGDIVYADTTDMALLRQKYDAQKTQPLYEKLRAACPIIGVWDDHDYGENDGGRSYPKRVESQQALLDFLDEPPGSPRRTQAGVHAAYTYGPAGKQVKVILLDERYSRDPPGAEAELLGEEQWRWLESQLTGSTADVHLIGSSTQLNASEHRFDKWADYPRDRQRLLDLLARSKPRRTIVLSGDRHLGEISKLAVPGLADPLYDVTSSGMTHYAGSAAKNLWYDFKKEPNRFRIGDNFLGCNFGIITIKWEASGPVIAMEIRDAQNVAHCRAALP
ncbi:MAG: alkaline phosphatase family protein [Pirellulaceae bacterium]|nr:alkaline phosphatase family protein [Pirellulaceae bacterium]